MKLADHAMGSAARAATERADPTDEILGSLAPAELALTSMPKWVSRRIAWMEQALLRAQRSRRRLERIEEGATAEYAEQLAIRQRAIDTAVTHFRELMAADFPVPSELVELFHLEAA